MNKTASARLRWLPGAACAITGFVLFQFWGNATRGYIATDSLFYWWGFQWVNPDSETEHGWLVLGLSIFLLWRNLRRVDVGDGPEATGAGVALAIGLMLHVVGFVAQQARVSILALLVYAWGVTALAGGRRWGRAAAFPMAFMVFAIPVNALDTLGFWLRMWVVQAGANIGHAMGIAVIRNGTQLVGPDGRYQYDVVAACSGMRSMVALAALSLFIGYMWFRPAWLRGAMLLLSIPLMYLGNVLRISAIILAAQLGGQRWGDLVHDVMGFGVFIIVMGGVIVAAEIISRARPTWTDSAFRVSARPPEHLGRASAAAVALAVVLAATAAVAFLSYRSAHPPDSRQGVLLAKGGVNPVELPTFLGSDWMGQSVVPSDVERAILPPDTGFSRKVYVNLETPSRRVLLSIVLTGRDRTSIHRPELCLVGQGWTIESSSTKRFSYPGKSGSDFDATVLHVRREVVGTKGTVSVPELVAYWFVGSDRIVASHAARMALDAWNRVAHGRADRWAYVLVQTGAADGEASALARIQEILNSTLPSFQPAFYPARQPGRGG